MNVSLRESSMRVDNWRHPFQSYVLLDVFAMAIFRKQSYKTSTHWFLSTKNIWNLQALKSTPLAGEWVSVVWTDILMEMFWFHTSLKCSSQEVMEQIHLNNDWLTNLNMQHLMRITYQSQVPDFRAFATRRKKSFISFQKAYSSYPSP